MSDKTVDYNPSKQADKDSNAISQQLVENDPAEAADILLQSVANVENQGSSGNWQQYRDIYLQALQNGMRNGSTADKLPQLQIAWAAHEDEFDLLSNEDGVITEKSLKQALRSATRDQDPISVEFITYIKDNYSRLRTEIGDADAGLSVDDLNKLIANRKTTESNNQSIQAKASMLEAQDVSALLLARKSGGASLFNLCDNPTGGKEDDVVGKNDIAHILSNLSNQDYHPKNSNGSTDTEKEAKLAELRKDPAAQAQLKFILDNWDKPSVQKLRDGNNITLDSLAKTAGVTDGKTLQQQVDQSQKNRQFSVNGMTITTDSAEANGKVTSVSSASGKRSFHYNSSGKVDGIRDFDGSISQMNDNGKWFNVSGDGKSLSPSNRTDVTVDSTGNVTFKMDGVSYVQAPNTMDVVENTNPNSPVIESTGKQPLDQKKELQLLSTLSNNPGLLSTVSDDGLNLNKAKVSALAQGIRTGNINFLNGKAITSQEGKMIELLDDNFDSLKSTNLDTLTKGAGDTRGWEHQLQLTGHGPVSHGDSETLQKALSSASFVNRFSNNGRITKASLSAAVAGSENSDLGLTDAEHKAAAILNNSFYTLSKDTDSIDVAAIVPNSKTDPAAGDKKPDPGTISDATTDGDKTEEKPKGYESLTPEAQSKLNHELINDFIERSKPKSGDGYIKVAARMLGTPDSNDSDPAVHKLWKLLSDANGGKVTKEGMPVLNRESLRALLEQDQNLKTLFFNTLASNASVYASQHPEDLAKK